MKRDVRKLVISVTPQTYYHLQDMAAACGYRNVGRVVDKLVREHQMATRIYTQKEREEQLHVWK